MLLAIRAILSVTLFLIPEGVWSWYKFSLLGIKFAVFI